MNLLLNIKILNICNEKQIHYSHYDQPRGGVPVVSLGGVGEPEVRGSAIGGEGATVGGSGTSVGGPGPSIWGPDDSNKNILINSITFIFFLI